MIWLLIIALTFAQAPQTNNVGTSDYPESEIVLETKLERYRVEEPYEIILARVTAYAPYDNKSGMCNNGDPNNTATMTKPRHGTLAVDPKKIPYGSKVYIPGYGDGVAEDTGGALRKYDGYAIDVYVDTYEEAMAWGVQYMYVKVYKEEW